MLEEDSVPQIKQNRGGGTMAGTILSIGRVVVNRRIQPAYPREMILIDPELSSGGPPEYDLYELEPWLHHNQRDNCSERGYVIYSHLRDTEGISRCLSLQDGMALQEKGLVAFRRFFGVNKCLPLWRSVVKHTSNNQLFVPCVFRDENKVAIGWHSLSSLFYSQDVTFKFPPDNTRKLFSEKVA